MGIGIVVVASPDNAGQIKQQLPEIKVIGEIIRQECETRVILA
jgi:phosphoribosylaminoimidazole (AIR) synthetase